MLLQFCHFHSPGTPRASPISATCTFTCQLARSSPTRDTFISLLWLGPDTVRPMRFCVDRRICPGGIWAQNPSCTGGIQFNPERVRPQMRAPPTLHFMRRQQVCWSGTHHPQGTLLACSWAPGISRALSMHRAGHHGGTLPPQHLSGLSAKGTGQTCSTHGGWPLVPALCKTRRVSWSSLTCVLQQRGVKIL